jgi:hypothetical protein
MREAIPTAPEVKPIARNANGSEIKAIFDCLVNHSTKKLQKRSLLRECLFMSGVIVAIAGILRTASKLSQVYGSIANSIGILLALVVLAAVVAVFILPSYVMMLWQPVRSVLLPEVERAQLDSDLLFALRQYDVSSLRYVDQRLRMAVDHFRGRIGTIASAIYKVGLIPLLLGWLFAGEKVFPDVTKSKYIIIGSCGLVFFYLQSLIAVFASNRVEQLAQVVRFVLEDERDSQE